MLDSIRFVNCQSFEDVTIPFVQDRINVLIADNSTGKSILYKMLKVTANPACLPVKERNLLIRYGATAAHMMCLFTDGCIGITTITKNKVLYRFKHQDDADFISQLEPPTEFIEHLGLIVDKRTKFIANIIDTEQDMLLVDSDQKGNNELLKLIAEDAVIVDVKEKIGNLIADFRSYNSDLIMKQSGLQQTINILGVADVDTLRYEYEQSQIAYSILLLVTSMEEQLEVIESNSADTYNYSDTIAMIEALLLFTNIGSLVNNVHVVRDEITSAPDIVILFLICIQELDCVTVEEDLDFNVELINDLFAVQKLLAQVSVQHDNHDLEDLELYSGVYMILRKLNAISYHKREFDAIESDCFNIVENMERSSERVVCPIHGEVLYNGQECVPYNI